MNKELVTDPLGIDDLRSDLRTNMELLQTKGVAEVLVMFGFSWGRRIYDGPWQDISMAPDELEKSITDAEAKQFGRLGSDNLYITIPALNARLNYSYEADIHLSYMDENEFVQQVKSRWDANRWLTESQRSSTYNR